mmetsp:Transcript_41757/g.65206  ORF Transcript_41757/g.65206 Transcript_41757/m.65206 type:complete len:120 (-) Transcript_41757:541-900(-)
MRLGLAKSHGAPLLEEIILGPCRRGCDASGKLLQADQTWADCCPASNQARTSEALPTPEEHPVLGEPFFALHPCKTQEFMKDFAGINRAENGSVFNYLLSWLTVFGAAVGLRIPLELLT